MHRLILATVGLVALAVSSPATAAGLVEAGELEHARANARAGGPISERDAELLERWGCLSGTGNPFCYNLSLRGHWHRVHRRRAYR